MNPSNNHQQPRKPGRPRKINPEEKELNYSEETAPSDPGAVDLEVEGHNEGDILSQASQALAGVAPKLSKNQRYKANKKARTQASTQQFSDIVITLLTLILSAWAMPENLKPNEEEINAFSVPATNILLRHVPIASKLSQDAIDMIGMIGAASAYYIRTRDAWTAYNATRQNKPQKVEGAAVTTENEEDDPFMYHPRPSDVIPAGV